MPRPLVVLSLTVVLLVSSLQTVAPTNEARAQDAPETIMAGYGAADASWHVGAGAGQYSAKSPDQTGLLTGDGIDPHQHSLSQKDSYGVHSRLSYRAIVVRDTEGDVAAFVKSDSYLAQDYLTRRVGQILEARGSGVAYEDILLMASHNHSSPYYTSPSWGVWIFQDVADLRAFEYHARAMADAISAAEEAMVPAKMAATTVEHKIFKGMIARKTIADDGTPAGYPDDFGDFGLPVIRFDSLAGDPIATLINWGQHPEGLDDHDLITGDFVAPLERFVERATGAPLVFGQGDVGSAEAGPGRPELVPDGIPKRWSHAGHAQAERGAFLLAQDVIDGWKKAARPRAQVPFSADFDVAAVTRFVPAPLSHPYPSVSNCNTETTLGGDPGVPIGGLPDCARSGGIEDERLNMVYENLRMHGFPVPAQYDAPAFTAVEENLRLKLQVFKLGEVLLASCACEAQVDLILNLESRLDRIEDNLWDGYDWTERLGCSSDGAGGDWTCADPHDASKTLTFSDLEYRRMVAQIHNDARGWNDPANVATANTDPADPSAIWGNFTHDELSTDLGYVLPIGVGHGGDYNGYTVSYREYMAYDHYRKALTCCGPHTADYMVSNLVELAGELNGGPAYTPEPHDAAAQADEARQVAAATVLGQASSAAYDAWLAALPGDVGPAAIVEQPLPIRRFDAATVSWRGGSNAVDNPVVTVERLRGGKWRPFADQTGEIQTMVEFPAGVNGFLDTYAGNEEWIWTAAFEAFDAFPRKIGSTPTGTYRFVISGNIRGGSATESYRLESEPFEVEAWNGITVGDLEVAPDGSVSFAIDHAYPETYESAFPYVAMEMKDDVVGVPFCATCSFRPWALTGEIVRAVVTVLRADGSIDRVNAFPSGDRWVALTDLGPGDSVEIEPGAIRDSYGESNNP
ncbi:MAG: hypothetical protein GEU71_15075 [Actinobacteria bacterium]|nr:hypothetical protein [Actinomycetota bacterium]